MKKIWIISIVTVLMASLVPLSLADEAENMQQDEDTQDETEIMDDQIGAYIRLLQLEKAIIKNIVKGEEIVSVLNESEINTTTLEAILAELELLKEEVQSADPNSTDAVQIFVDLKNDSVELTKDFRETLHKLVNESTLEQLRERIRLMMCEQVQNLSKKIQNQIRLFNRNQLHRIYGILGQVNISIINEYQNGNVTKEQAKQQISKMINQMTKEKRYQIFSELKEAKIRERIQARVCVENATEDFQERKETRITNRIRNAQNIDDNQIREEMEQRMRTRLNNMNPDGSGGNGNGSGGQGGKE